MIWPTKKLGEIREEIKKEKADVGIIPYIEIGNVDVESKKISFTEKGAVGGSIFAPENSILISRVRPTRGAVILIDKKMAVSSAFTIIKPKPEISPKLLFYFLAWNKKFFDYLGIKQKGTNYPSVRENDVLDFEISFPEDSAEQQKIVYVLDSIQEAVRVQEKIIEKTKELKRSLMQKLFREGTIEKSKIKSQKSKIQFKIQKWVKLGEIAKIERGKFAHRPRNDPAFYSGDIPFIQTSDVTLSDGYIKKYSQTLNKKGLSVSKIFPKGTIVITIAANIGYSAILDFDSAFPDSLIGITPDKGINKEFLNYYLMTQQEKMDREAARGTQKNINIQFLKPWPVPLLPLKEQREIAEILQTVDQKIEIEKKKKALYEELFKTMLNKLMTGEIRLNELNFKDSKV